jgi:hypothetical protein
VFIPAEGVLAKTVPHERDGLVGIAVLPPGFEKLHDGLRNDRNGDFLIDGIL